MKTITTALIAATLAIATSSASAVDRFKQYRDTKATVPVCASAQSMVDLLNASQRGDQQEMKAIMRKECTLVPQANREFEITTEWRHVSEIAFYKGQCQLDSQKHYIANTTILSYTPQEIEQINAQLKTMARNNKAISVTLIEPPICNTVNQAADTTEDTDHSVATTTLRKDINPEDLIVCMTVDQAKELEGMQDGWPKGCFAGAPSRTAFIQDVSGKFVEAVFIMDNDKVSDAYWLSKDSFNQ